MNTASRSAVPRLSSGLRSFFTSSRKNIKVKQYYSPEGRVTVAPKYHELRRIFQTDDGKLTWQKLPMDMPLYYLAILMTTVLTAITLKNVYAMAYQPRPKRRQN